MASAEEFDDPFKSLSSSNLEDLALGNHAGDDTHRGGGGNNDAMTNNSMAISSDDDDDDPWAVLAAAAGEAAVSDNNLDPSATATTTVTLTHSEGESFSMPNAASSQQQSSSSTTSSIIGQIRSSTTNLIHEVDSKTGISTRARIVDDQLHITEKWTNFHSQILLPTTNKTREIVQEKIAPSVKEHWGSLQQRTAEMGVKERLANVSSTVGQTWNETTSRVGHWREEQEMKRALANARNETVYGDTGGSTPSTSYDHHQFQQSARGKVVEGWNWLSQRIQDAKIGQQQRQPNSRGDGEEIVPDNQASKMKHLDSDGLPSSFRKD